MNEICDVMVSTDTDSLLDISFKLKIIDPKTQFANRHNQEKYLKQVFQITWETGA